MTTPRQRWRALAAASLTAIAVTSCGGSPSAAPTTVQSSALASDGPAGSALPDADKKACVGVQAQSRVAYSSLKKVCALSP